VWISHSRGFKKLSDISKDRKCLVVRADEIPTSPHPQRSRENVRYKNPKIYVENRSLNPLQPGHLRLEMIYAGICGTDIHLVQTDSAGFVATSAPLQIPSEGRIMGHEGVGRVLSVGVGTSQFKLGDIVGLESIITCQVCEQCRRGQFNQCSQAKLIGMEVDGLFGSVIDVPATVAHNVNGISKDDCGLKAAACLEPACVAWLACHKASITAGDRVMIFGGGPIGFYCAMLARLIFGASWIGLVDPVTFRREHAGSWCDEIYDTSDERIEMAKVDVIIEASGFLNNLQRVIAGVKANGRIVLLARSGQPFKLDAIDHIITNNINIIGVRGHLGGAFGRVISLYQAGKLPLSQATTSVIESLETLEKHLSHPDHLINHNCKVLVQLSQ
jgi:threonine dehydrogenase-like Zn-dependent dehydrogenase